MQVDLLTFLLVEGLIAAGIIIWRLMKKCERQEAVIINQQNTLDTINSIIITSNEHLEEIDQKGTFRSDDEVGFFFENLKVIQQELNKV